MQCLGDSTNPGAALAGERPVTVAAGVVLGGYGSITGNVTNDGTLGAGMGTPGYFTSPTGTFTINGNLFNNAIANVGDSLPTCFCTIRRLFGTVVKTEPGEALPPLFSGLTCTTLSSGLDEVLSQAFAQQSPGGHLDQPNIGRVLRAEHFKPNSTVRIGPSKFLTVPASPTVLVTSKKANERCASAGAIPIAVSIAAPRSAFNGSVFIAASEAPRLTNISSLNPIWNLGAVYTGLR